MAHNNKQLVIMIHTKKIVNFRFLHFVVRLFRFILNRTAENIDHLAELRNKKNPSGSIAKKKKQNIESTSRFEDETKKQTKIMAVKIYLRGRRTAFRVITFHKI
jgi:hypothetical protein